jgi:hypothetical protein
MPFQYYSKSKTKSFNIAGNRCSQTYTPPNRRFPAEVNVRVSIEQLETQKHRVRFDMLAGCPDYLCLRGLWGTLSPIGEPLPGEIVK